MSQLASMKFCLAFPGSRQFYKFFINYILRLHVKSFITARRDPTFVLSGFGFAETKFSDVIASPYLSGMKQIIAHINLKKSIEVYFNRS